MFDGFDELGSRAARNHMARLIDDLATTYDHPENRFIVSTRIVGYEGQLDTHGFIVRTVEELSPDAVRDLVKRRYQAVALGEGLGRSEQEQKDLIQLYTNRANDLLMELEKKRFFESPNAKSITAFSYCPGLPGSGETARATPYSVQGLC